MTSKFTPTQKKPARPSRGALSKATLPAQKRNTIALLRKQAASADLPGQLPELAKPKPIPWQPEPYQKEGVKFLLEHACAGLFLDPGLRKTSITLGAIKILKKEGMLGRVLIIAPLRVCYSVWPREVQKWKDFGHLRVEILHGDDKEAALRRDADIYLINPEGLEWLLGVTKTKKEGQKKATITYDFTRFKLLAADTLVIDEASKFKRYSSDRFRILAGVLNKFWRRWALTGSPAPNGLMDLFGVMYCIDMGRALGQYITHFRNAYFMSTGYGGYTYTLQPGAEDRIYERIAPTVFRLADEDFIKLPELVENVIYVELPAKVRRLYDELEEDFLTDLDGGIANITAVNAGVAAIKCRQVANGGLLLAQEVDEQGAKQGGPREWVDLHFEKVDAVQDLVEEIGSPAIITFDFQHDLARLLDRFGKDSAVIGGGISPKESDKIVDKWNAGKLPWLFGHPSSMAHGLNMQDGNAQHVIWHSLTYNYEEYDQLIRRLRRSGNKAKRVFVHHIVARDTVDEAIMIALRKKKRTQGALLDALKEYSDKRRLARRSALKSLRK